MPVKNSIKVYSENSYYYIYNFGVANSDIYVDDQDYITYLSLLKRHLTRQKESNKRGQEYESFAGRLELEAYCLTPKSYHILLYLNNDSSAIAEIMRRVSGSYTTYFNKKYGRKGPLFQGVYKAINVSDDSHLLHISRFIHRIPEDYYNWQYSSLNYYIGDWSADWVVPDRVYKLYEWGTYENYLNDTEGYKTLNSEYGLGL